MKSSPFSCELAPRGYEAAGPRGPGQPLWPCAPRPAGCGGREGERGALRGGVMAAAGGPALRSSKVRGDEGRSRPLGAQHPGLQTPAPCPHGTESRPAWPLEKVPPGGAGSWEQQEQTSPPLYPGCLLLPHQVPHSPLLPAALKQDRASPAGRKVGVRRRGSKSAPGCTAQGSEDPRTPLPQTQELL